MKRLIVIIAMLLLTTFSSSAQQKVRGPIWISDDANTDVIGLSIAAYPKGLFQGGNTPMSRTFGVKLEVFPLSPLYVLFVDQSHLKSDSEQTFQNILKEEINEKVYGLNFETGSFSETDIYGISISGVFHYSRKSNGINIAGVYNTIELSNGLMMGVIGNEVYSGNGMMISGVVNYAQQFNGMQISLSNHINNRGAGLQIGLFNRAKNFRGIQLGLWNKNDKRSLPIINWQFSE